jgi:arsenic resistance protein ArsH
MPLLYQVKITVKFLNVLFSFVTFLTLGSMLYYFRQRVPSILRPAISQSLLRPKYSGRMFSAIPQADASYRTLALSPSEDSPDIRQKYRPFILDDNSTEDWVNELDLATAADMAENNLRVTNQRLKVLVLYGSLRKRSYSRLVALEASRILFRLGCDVRVFDPEGLPVKNEIDTAHPKVQELRELSLWSDGHVWVSPEQHGNLVSESRRYT